LSRVKYTMIVYAAYADVITNKRDFKIVGILLNFI
jgi:hypothetical protein